MLLVAGCDGVAGIGEENQSTFSQTVSHQVLASESPKTTEIKQGQYGDLEGGTTVMIEDDGEYADLWSQLHANRDSIPPRPAVNFSEETLVAVVMESQSTGGHRVSIDNALLNDRGTQAQIQYTEHMPGDNCGVTLAFTTPYVLATIDVPVNDIQFNGSQTVHSCEE